MFLQEKTVVLVLGCMVAYFVARQIVTWYRQITNRHKGAVRLAEWARGYGLTRLPNILLDYGTGDFVGAAEQIEEFVQLLEKAPGEVEKEFDSVFMNVLAKKLATQTGLAVVQAAVTDATKSKSTSTAS
ncbi:MAG TPA: hypothetical protein VFE46_10815 [Pirellulales bacterium]|jgi:hypothetical protein|nr:hypothetical protein [Pirellulales bacterium]